MGGQQAAREMEEKGEDGENAPEGSSDKGVSSTLVIRQLSGDSKVR